MRYSHLNFGAYVEPEKLDAVKSKFLSAMENEGYRNLLDSLPEKAKEKSIADMRTAVLLQQAYGVDEEFAAHFADSFRKGMYPEIKTADGVDEMLYKRWQSGGVLRELGAEADRIAKIKDKAERERLWKEKIEPLEKELEKYAAVPASKAAHYLGEAAGSVSLMRDSMIGGAAAAAGTAALAAALPPVSAAILAAGGKLVSASALLDAGRTRGLAYYDMAKSGIEHETADSYSAMSAAAVTGLEILFGGVLPGGLATHALQGTAAKKILAMSLDKSGKTLSLKQIAAKAAGAQTFTGGIDLAFEGVTEAAQSLAQNALLAVAGRKSDEKDDLRKTLAGEPIDLVMTGVNWLELESRMESAGESFAAGIAMAGLMGLPSGVVRFPASMMEAKNIIKNAAEQIVAAPSLEEAEERAAKSGVAEYVKPEELKAFAGELYAASRSAGDEAAAPFMKNALRPTAMYPAPMRRKRDGGLNLVYRRPKADGLDKGSVSVLDPYEKGAAMGKIGYRVDEDGITVDGADIGRFKDGANYITDYAKVAEDAVRALREDYGGIPVKWNADAPDFAWMKEKLAAINAEPVKAERDVNSVLRKFLGLDGKILVTGSRADLSAAERAEMERTEALGGIIKGAALGVKTVGGKQRRVIYIDGKEADAATLPHEMIHAYTREAAPEQRDRLSKAMGLADSAEESWAALSFKSRTGKDINAHEKLAEYWEDYLARDNRLIPSEVKALFDRLAAAIQKIFDALGYEPQEIPADLRAVFDGLVTGKEARGIDADGAVGKRDGGALFSTKDADKEISKRIEEFKNAPNIRLQADGYRGKYEITGDPKADKASIEDYLYTLRDKDFHNAGIDSPVKISRRTVQKITSFGMNNELYKKLIAHIPELIEKSTYITEDSPKKKKHHYSAYKELVAGVELEEEENEKTERFVIRSVLGVENGIAYYSFFVSKLDKAELFQAFQGPNSVSVSSALSSLKDNGLLEILQTNTTSGDISLSANPGEKSSPDFSPDKHISDLQGEMNDGSKEVSEGTRGQENRGSVVREDRNDGGLRDDGGAVQTGPDPALGGGSVETNRQGSPAQNTGGIGDGAGSGEQGIQSTATGISAARSFVAAAEDLKTPGPAPATDDGSLVLLVLGENLTPEQVAEARRRNKEVMEGKAVASVSSKDIPIMDGKIINTAMQWTEGKLQDSTNTVIGSVKITKDGIRADFSHTKYPNKLYSLPAIRPILEQGAYLGMMDDIHGKKIKNHYFAAPVNFDDGRKIVFLRVRETGAEKSFYVHEVFVSEEIEKAEPLSTVLSKIGNRMQAVDPNQKQNSTKRPDVYRSIIKDALQQDTSNPDTPLSDTSPDKSSPLAYEEVESRYTNPDGTKTEEWMKAPNGEPTKLDERQWVQVRTPNFKKWFGDWEKLADLTLDSATADLAKTKEALSRLAGVDLVNEATGITARIGATQRNKIMSNAALGKSLKNGFSRQQHNAAAARIDKLWKYAEQIAEHPDRDNDINIKSIKRFAAPVIFGEETGTAYITVKESIDRGHRIYSIELQEIKKPRPKGSTPKERTTATGFDLSIAQKLEKVKGEVSQVRDAETGEPLAVYHAGTFRKEDIPLPAMHFGTYKAANDRIKRKRKNKESYTMNEVFLNIKNPSPQPDWGLSWKSPVEYAKKEGHDGILYTNKYEDIGSLSFIAFNPEQIKSATDNAGTFSAADSSILYQLAEEDADRAVEKYATPQEWMNAEREAEKDRPDAVPSEGWDDGDEARKYEAMFNGAADRRGRRMRAEGRTVITTGAADNLFIEKMENKKELLKFKEILNSYLYEDPVADGYTDTPERENIRRYVKAHAAGVFWIGAEKSQKPKVSPEQEKAMLKAIKDNPTQYRYLYTQVADDPEYSGYLKNEVNNRPYVLRAFKEGAKTGLTIREQGQLAARLEAADIRKAAEAGEIDDTRFAALIKAADADNEKTAAAIKAKNAELKKAEEELGEDRRVILALRKQAEEADGKVKELQKSGKAESGKLKTARVNRDSLYAKLKAEAAMRKADIHSAAVEKTLEKWRAVEKLKARYRAKAEETRAAQKLLNEKKRLMRSIMKEAGQSIWHGQREAVKQIQALLDPAKPGARVKHEGKFYAVADFKAKAAAGEIVFDTLSPRLRERIAKRSMAEMTLGELGDIAEEVKLLRAEGRANWKNRQETGRARRIMRMEQALAALAEKAKDEKSAAGKRAKKFEEAKTEEEQEKVIKGNALNAFGDAADFFSDADIVLDGMGDDLKRFLFDEVIDAFRRKEDALYSRLIETFGEFGPASKERLARDYSVKNIGAEGIGPDGTAAALSKADLMALYIGMENARFRAHFLYGNLLSTSERLEMESAVAAGRLDAEKIEETYGKPKEAVIKGLVKQHLDGADRALAERIRDNFAEHYGELKDTVFEMFNEDIGNENSYLPLFMTGGARGKLTEAQEKEQVLNAGALQIKATPDRGMTKSRADIAPWNQAPIETDIIKLFMKGADREEHFKALAPQVRDMNAVIKGETARSRELAHRIKVLYGEAKLRRIQKWINTAAAPGQAVKSDGEKILDGLMGKASAALVGGNIVSLAKQYPQSLQPFFGYASFASIAKSAGQWIRGVKEGKGGIEKLSEGNAQHLAAYAKSAEMRTRVNSIQKGYALATREADAAMRKGAAEAAKRGLHKFVRFGLWGQNQSDIMMATIGWTAVYSETLAKTKDEAAAVSAADRALRESQPNMNAYAASEAFRDGSGMWRGLMLFGLPLNRIFNMYRRLPKAIAEKNYRYAVNTILGQAVLGIAIAGIFGKLSDDGDDPAKIARKAAYYAAEPALSALPVAYVSSIAQWGAERIITGEKTGLYKNSPLPLVDAAVSAAVDIAEWKTGKFAADAADVAGYAFGLPSAQVKRLMRSIEEEDPLWFFGMQGWRD
jgi:hypothetical protein